MQDFILITPEGQAAGMLADALERYERERDVEARTITLPCTQYRDLGDVTPPAMPARGVMQ